MQIKNLKRIQFGKIKNGAINHDRKPLVKGVKSVYMYLVTFYRYIDNKKGDVLN